MSTGARTPEGKARVLAALIEGRQRWLEEMRAKKKAGQCWKARKGSLKSTLVRILAGEGNFSDADILESDKREQQELCEGVLVYEIAGLSAAQE
jgi:hypothetical protein